MLLDRNPPIGGLGDDGVQGKLQPIKHGVREWWRPYIQFYLDLFVQELNGLELMCLANGCFNAFFNGQFLSSTDEQVRWFSRFFVAIIVIVGLGSRTKLIATRYCPMVEIFGECTHDKHPCEKAQKKEQALTGMHVLQVVSHTTIDTPINAYTVSPAQSASNDSTTPDNVVSVRHVVFSDRTTVIAL